MNCTITFYIEEILLRLLTFHLYGYSQSTSTVTHIALLQLPTIHFYGYSQYTSSEANHNTRLLQLLTINFYSYSQLTSSATHNTFLQRLFIIHFFHCYHQPLVRLLTFRSLWLFTINSLCAYSQSPSASTHNTCTATHNPLHNHDGDG
jgi:hypothetical protein